MKLTMQLRKNSYDIILKRGCLKNLYQFANLVNRKVFILTDDGVPVAYAQTIAGQCSDPKIYTIPQGEGSKCLKVYGKVLEEMLAFGMSRSDVVVAVGGGVVGDLGRFLLPPCYMRGIDFINMPHHHSGPDRLLHRRQDGHRPGGDQKHCGGLLAAPAWCSSTPTCWTPCPGASTVNGLAEALKAAVIADAPNCFALFEKNDARGRTSSRSSTAALRVKEHIVEQDERESRPPGRLLNFGHTIGHGIEAVKGIWGRRKTASTTASASPWACCP